MKLLFIILIIFCFNACSTIPVTQQTANYIPPKRIYQTSYIGSASNSSTESTLVFLRDKGLFGSGCSHDIYVDNVKIFSIRQNEQITIHVSGGQHFIRLETGGGLCPNISTSQNVNLAPGTSQTYRILLPSDGSLRLTRIE